MKYKYSVLKSSWGIVIFTEIHEIKNPVINDTDVKISDRIYLRLKNIEIIKEDIIKYWMRKGINPLRKEIEEKIQCDTVCFELQELSFNHADFQEEGLFCAFQGWAAKYYDIKIPTVNVSFDKKKNKYFFDIPQ